MNLRRYLPCFAVCLLGFAPVLQAHASDFATSGTFAADNSVYSYNFSTTSTDLLNASTTSFATGGFDPVLTLFNVTTGAEVDNDGTGLSDATLSDLLPAGAYVLDLTEFPNVANGDLADGFLFAGDPTATGDLLGIPGGMFLDDITGAQLTDNYSLNVSVAPTPEPSSWLLMLSGAVGVFYASRRRRLA